jgi:hypothetical protein
VAVVVFTPSDGNRNVPLHFFLAKTKFITPAVRALKEDESPFALSRAPAAPPETFFARAHQLPTT